ncbi:chromosome partition protein MukE [Thioalkalivibrio sp. HK1]|uniref:chromosome partition protein MukE n=1 Tax=Thioalkalivibrio sp. HK1 TaxID=1469245 RepID=UPI000471BD38|nr:condensin subunit E [Thioalkalivibrio sp. HK1]
MTSSFESLEEAIADEHFPGVDLALRRGRHLSLDDGTAYQYLIDALDHLEPFYRRFGCELVHPSDGYFYLLPSGDRLDRRRLSTGEMLIGQTLALMYLDPAALQYAGVVERQTLLQRLQGMLGAETLVRILDPRRRKKFNERIFAEIIRNKVAEALRRLAELGFIDTLDGGRLRLRPSLMRFVEPVRGSKDCSAALERLVASGEIDLDDADLNADPGVDPSDPEAEDEAPEDEPETSA